MEQIKEESILEIKKFIVPQLQPTRATQKANSQSPLVKRPLKGVKYSQPKQVPLLNLKSINQMPNSFSHIEANLNSQDTIMSKKYMNAPLGEISAFNTTKNSYNTAYYTTRQTNWQEAYSPSENFSKMVLRSEKKKQSLPAMTTPKNLSQREIDLQCQSLNNIKSINNIPEMSKDEVIQRGTFSHLTELDRRKVSSQLNIRASRRLDSTDISKFTAQQNSQITQSLIIIDDIETKNIFKQGKDQDFKITNADFLKELFKEQYSEYQTIRLGQKLHVKLCFGESQLIKIRILDKNFPIIFRTFSNSGYFTIYFSKKYRHQQPPDLLVHDYVMQQTERSITLYDGLSPSEETKYIFVHITSQTNCDFELMALGQKQKEEIIPVHSSMKDLKQKGFIQFNSNDKIFMKEIAEIRKRRREKSLKLSMNKNYVKMNSEVVPDFRDKILERLNGNKIRTEKVKEIQKKKEDLFDQKIEKNIIWLTKNDVKKQERLKIEGKENKVKFDKNWIGLITIPKIFNQLRLVIFKHKMWNKRIERAKDLLKKFFKGVLEKFRSRKIEEKMMIYSTIYVRMYASKVKQNAKEKGGQLLQQFLIKAAESWLLDAKLKNFQKKVRFIQVWYRKMYEQRTEYLNKYWSEICNQLLSDEKKRKINLMKEAPARLFKKSVINLERINPLGEVSLNSQQNGYNISTRVSAINNDQKKACIKFFRKSVIERRVLMQRIKSGLLQVNDDIIDQANAINSSSQLSPLSQQENQNNSQSEQSIMSNSNTKGKKSHLSFASPPPFSPVKMGLQLLKITQTKLGLLKKKKKRNKSPSLNTTTIPEAIDCINDQEFINCKLSIDKFENHSINPYFMMDLSLQDKARFQFYPTQIETFIDIIKKCIVSKKKNDIFVIKEDEESKLKSRKSQILKSQKSININRLILQKGKQTPFPMLQLKVNNSFDINVLSFKKLAQCELVLLKKLILDAPEYTLTQKGWKS